MVANLFTLVIDHLRFVKIRHTLYAYVKSLTRKWNFGIIRNKAKILDPLKLKTMLCNFHSTKELSVREIGTTPNVVNNFFQTKKDVLNFTIMFLNSWNNNSQWVILNSFQRYIIFIINLVTYLHDVLPIPHGQGKALLFSWIIPTKCAKYVHTLPCRHLTIFEWVEKGFFFLFFASWKGSTYLPQCILIFILYFFGLIVMLSH
jgi:hypothetical protein